MVRNALPSFKGQIFKETLLLRAMQSVPFFTTVPTAVPTTAPTRSLHGPYSPYRNPRPCAFLQQQRIHPSKMPPHSKRQAVLNFLLWTCDMQRECCGDLPTPMPPGHMQNSLGRLCLRVQNGIPSRPERKKRPLYVLPTHPLAMASRPLPCNVVGFGIQISNKKGTIFRTGNPVPGSALLATNIA